MASALKKTIISWFGGGREGGDDDQRVSPEELFGECREKLKDLDCVLDDVDQKLEEDGVDWAMRRREDFEQLRYLAKGMAERLWEASNRWDEWCKACDEDGAHDSFAEVSVTRAMLKEKG